MDRSEQGQRKNAMEEQRLMEMRGVRTVAHLGDDLIIAEILTRLPARSVLRFRAVCKAWRRATAEPDFLAAHTRRRPLEVLIYTRVMSPCVPKHNLELDAMPVTLCGANHRPATAPRRPLARFPEYIGNKMYCTLLASCDGLLLLENGVERGQYLVCNPATRQWTDLPLLSTDGDDEGDDGALLPWPFDDADDLRESGFYFHEPSGEYRLLCHVASNMHATRYHVFSTGSDEPRRLNVKATPMHHNIADDTVANLMTPAVLGGCLHWLRHMEAGLSDQMVAFDTVAETFRRMPPPPVTRKEHANLLVADGSLIASVLGDLFVDLWVLKGYGGTAVGEERWEHRHRVEVPLYAIAKKPLVVAGGDDGDIIVGTRQGLEVCNVRSGTVRQVAVKSNGYLSRSVYRESLVRHGFFEARPHPGLPLFSFSR